MENFETRDSLLLHLDHLLQAFLQVFFSIAIILVYWNKFFTELIKFAALEDHPGGISSSFILTCFDSI